MTTRARESPDKVTVPSPAAWMGCRAWLRYPRPGDLTPTSVQAGQTARQRPEGPVIRVDSPTERPWTPMRCTDRGKAERRGNGRYQTQDKNVIVHVASLACQARDLCVPRGRLWRTLKLGNLWMALSRRLWPARVSRDITSRFYRLLVAIVAVVPSELGRQNVVGRESDQPVGRQTK